jgi:Uma2 family endonuclease
MTVTTEFPKKITFTKFLKMDLDENFYYELINGVVVKKQAPSPAHQEAVTNLSTLFNNYIKEHQLGKCYVSPIDVYFDKYNNSQPDIIFIKKDREFIITKDGIQGQPDLIVEVLSPSTYKIDRNSKFNLYLKFGVSEYWIVDPKTKIVEVYSLQQSYYEMTAHALETGEVESQVLKGLKIDLDKIF